MDPADDRVSLVIHWAAATMESGIGSTYCRNGGPYLPCPVGAVITHFNRNEANAYEVAVMSRVTGPVIGALGGWFIRFPAGTPPTVSFTDMQIDHNTLLHVAIPYPAGTTFNIYAKAPSWCNPGTVPYKPWNSICQHAYRPVDSIDEVRTSWGDTYYYDSTAQLLHIRIISLDSFSYQFATNGTYSQNTIWNATSLHSTYFSRGGLNLLVTGSTFWSVVIEASNCQPLCARIPEVSVPGINGSRDYTGPPQTPTNFTDIWYPSSAVPNYGVFGSFVVWFWLLFAWIYSA